MKTKKSYYVATLISFIVLVCIFTFQSCQKKDSSATETKKVKPSIPSNWQDQLKFVKFNENVLAKNGVQMISFQYQGKLNSTEDVNSVKSKILAEENMVPIHDTLNIFHLASISETLKDNSAKKSKFSFFILRRYLDTLIKPEMGTVNINWEYKGEKFSSICVVSDQGGVVYDNLMSNIFTFSIEKPVNTPSHQAFNGKVASLKTFSETAPNPNPKYYFNSGTYEQTNLWGTVCATAYVVFTVSGSNNNGVKSIVTYSGNGYPWASSGYSASASVTETAFVAGANGRCAFSYGVMVSSTSGLTLGWNGSSYTMPSGGSLGEVGVRNVIPSDLN